jgi:hypothetical protein
MNYWARCASKHQALRRPLLEQVCAKNGQPPDFVYIGIARTLAQSGESY